MGFRAGRKNEGAWFRFNQLVRDHHDFKTAVNGDTEVLEHLTAMQGILADEANKSGITLASISSNTLQSKGFPIPLRVWQGRLVYSFRDEGPGGSKPKGLTGNQVAFRNIAYELRSRCDDMTRAFSMLGDAVQADPATELNPGGNPSQDPIP